MRFFTRLGTGFLLGIALPLLVGCGVIGPPLPPEQIGIEAKIREQRAREHSEQPQEEQIIPIEEEKVVLPPLKPLGIH